MLNPVFLAHTFFPPCWAPAFIGGCLFGSRFGGSTLYHLTSLFFTPPGRGGAATLAHCGISKGNFVEAAAGAGHTQGGKKNEQGNHIRSGAPDGPLGGCPPDPPFDPQPGACWWNNGAGRKKKRKGKREGKTGLLYYLGWVALFGLAPVFAKGGDCGVVGEVVRGTGGGVGAHGRAGGPWPALGAFA